MSSIDRKERGTLAISGSRLSLGPVVHAFWAGETPEMICQAYPSLTLARIIHVLLDPVTLIRSCPVGAIS